MQVAFLQVLPMSRIFAAGRRFLWEGDVHADDSRCLGWCLSDSLRHLFVPGGRVFAGWFRISILAEYLGLLLLGFGPGVIHALYVLRTR